MEAVAVRLDAPAEPEGTTMLSADLRNPLLDALG
jgi:hypothetical protein